MWFCPLYELINIILIFFWHERRGYQTDISPSIASKFSRQDWVKRWKMRKRSRLRQNVPDSMFRKRTRSQSQMKPFRQRSIFWEVKPSVSKEFRQNLCCTLLFQCLSEEEKAEARAQQLPSKPCTLKKGLCYDSSTVKAASHSLRDILTPSFQRYLISLLNLSLQKQVSSQILRFLRFSSSFTCSQNNATSFFTLSVLMISSSPCSLFLLYSIPQSVLFLMATSSYQGWELLKFSYSLFSTLSSILTVLISICCILSSKSLYWEYFGRAFSQTLEVLVKSLERESLVLLLKSPYLSSQLAALFMQLLNLQSLEEERSTLLDYLLSSMFLEGGCLMFSDSFSALRLAVDLFFSLKGVNSIFNFLFSFQNSYILRWILEISSLIFFPLLRVSPLSLQASVDFLNESIWLLDLDPLSPLSLQSLRMVGVLYTSSSRLIGRETEQSLVQASNRLAEQSLFFGLWQSRGGLATKGSYLGLSYSLVLTLCISFGYSSSFALQTLYFSPTSEFL